MTQRDDYLLMSRTKTNRRTDREQYTRSNAATARLLTLVKPAETLARDWPNTNERRGMVTSTITLLSTIYRRNIKSTGTLRHVLRILQRLTFESCNLRQKPWNTLENSAPFCFPPPFCNVVVATQLCNNISTLQGERDVHRCFKDFWRGLCEV